MSSMIIYDQVRKTPKEALKPITGGRLKGKSDINPMYRIQVLTEQFGPCGIGWYYIPEKKWAEQAGNEILCFVDISLYIKYGNEWSKPISGTGGSAMLAKEASGLYANDECYKMATTDALSVACKQLGIAADVYWAAGESKYSRPAIVPDEPTEAPAPKAEPKPKPRQERIVNLCNYHKIDRARFNALVFEVQDENKMSRTDAELLDDTAFGTILSLVHTKLQTKATI